MGRVLFAALLAAPLLALAQPRIVAPQAGETVHSNSGTFTVQVAGAPRDARFRVLLDGEALGDPRPVPVFTLSGVDRGTHRLAVEVLDARGVLLARTAPVEFYVWQASRLMPSRRQQP